MLPGVRLHPQHFQHGGGDVVRWNRLGAVQTEPCLHGAAAVVFVRIGGDGDRRYGSQRRGSSEALEAREDILLTAWISPSGSTV